MAFMRDFPVVASAFGVAALYHKDWEDAKDLDEDEEKRNTLALLVLRQYLTERVLSVITVGRPRLRQNCIHAKWDWANHW